MAAALSSAAFSSFYGYYTGAEHYFEHIRDNFYDFRRNNRVEYSARWGRGGDGGDSEIGGEIIAVEGNP